MTTSDSGGRTDTLEPCFVIHARKYRDTSLILDLLAQIHGRYSVVVRGASSPRSKFKGRLQPFTPLLIASVGRGDLRTSTSIDFPQKPFQLTGDRLLLGMYVNELLYRLLGRFDPVPDLFQYYSNLMGDLQRADSAVGAVRRFELLLLQELGYGINFESEAGTGEKIEAAAIYRFVTHEGFHRIAEPQPGSVNGNELVALLEGSELPLESKVLRDITRRSLGALLGDKPLRSRALFKGGVR